MPSHHRLRAFAPATLVLTLVSATSVAQAPPTGTTPQLIARFGRMSAPQFAALLPDEGFQLCSRNAENAARAETASGASDCTTYTRAQVVDPLWSSELRDRVHSTMRITCRPAGALERCTTPPVRGEPPGGSLWFFRGRGAARRLVRVINWSIDM